MLQALPVMHYVIKISIFVESLWWQDRFCGSPINQIKGELKAKKLEFLFTL